MQAQYAVGGLKELVINTVNFDKSGSSILLDGEADMAYINMSDVIKDSAAVDMVAIAKTLDKDPQMVMWGDGEFRNHSSIGARSCLCRRRAGAATRSSQAAEWATRSPARTPSL